MEITKKQTIKNLLLNDGEKVYILKVSEDDYKRAQNDMNYATSLLFHARANGTNVNVLENISLEGNSEQQENDENPSESYVHNDDSMTVNKGVWLYDEVICLINSMATHIEDLNHPKKKKYVFENVANDLISSNFQVSAPQCQVKWKSLIRSYKACKDAKSKTGRGPTKFNFFDQMDELLGNKPSSNCNHVLESSSIQNALEVNSDSSCNGSINEMSELTDMETPSQRKKLKKNSTLPEKLLSLKREEYERREARHKERMEMEERKMQLLERFLENKNK